LNDWSKGFLDSLALIWTVGGKLNKDGHNIQHSNEVGTNFVIKIWKLPYSLLIKCFDIERG
jgi:hypothetical protein